MSDSNKIDWEAVRERLHVSEQRLAEVLAPNPERVRRIQLERAAHLASRRSTGAAEPVVPILIADLGEEKIAVQLTAVSEVLPIDTLPFVAGAPAGIRGVINLHGELYSVMDAISILRPNEVGEKIAWGVALRHPVLRIVLGVHSVLNIENIPARFLQAAEDNVLRIQNGIAVILDTRKILERLEVEAAASITTLQDPS